MRITPQHKRHRLRHITVGKTTKQNIHTEDLYNGSQMQPNGLLPFAKAFVHLQLEQKYLSSFEGHRTSTKDATSAYSTFHTATCTVFCSFTLSLPEHRNTENKPHLIVLSLEPTQRGSGREGEGKEKEEEEPVLALSHFPESQPRHRRCGPAHWAKGACYPLWQGLVLHVRAKCVCHIWRLQRY